MLARFLSTLALAAAALGAHANLLTNGSFEDTTLPSSGYVQSQSIPGWTATTGLVEVGRASNYGVTGQTGNNVLELDSNANSVVTQTLSLGAGTYLFNFDYAKRAGTTDETNAFDVLWNGSVVTAITPTSTAFSTATFRLSGVTGTNTLSFQAKGTSDALGGMIDNVNVQPTPEPATMAALGLGILGLLRRRKA